ncbi:MAG TPA: trimeric intracellular cation channel family protein, partial [Porphyromonadaceae bacterium]|nr:trimeric intracellular cation channel family protein [Porphyromonadaceae bacterium]
MELIENIQFVNIIEFLGTFAFAISGVRMASTKNFDLFGAFTIGFVTAIGGGTLRDLFIGVTPFWMLNPVYL